MRRFSRSPARLAAIFPSLCLAALAISPRAAAADAAAGARLAQRWCAGCHLVGAAQTAPVPQGPPSFASVAKSGLDADRLRAFLSHPHGAMPDLSLTRAEIDDLVAYILSQR